MSPTGFEPVTPSLKVRCSKPSELRRLCLSDRGRTCGLRVPNSPLYQTELHLVKTNTLTPFGLWRTRIIHSVLVSGRVRCRSPYLSVPPVFKTGSQAAVITLPIIVVPQGFEPQFHGPKPCVLPIRRGNNNETNMSKNFFFWGLYQVRTDDSGLQSRDITNYTKRPI